jgi:hypothetical protein
MKWPIEIPEPEDYLIATTSRGQSLGIKLRRIIDKLVERVNQLEETVDYLSDNAPPFK